MDLRNFGGWWGIASGALILSIPGGLVTEYLHYRLPSWWLGEKPRISNYWDWDVFLAGAGGTWILVVGAILLFGVRR